MPPLRFVLCFVACGGALVGACATGEQLGGGMDSGGDATATGDGGSCAQFDLQTDPNHCGSCTNACSTEGGIPQVCTQGVCMCGPPTIKCSGTQTCTNVTKDPNNCGKCDIVCAGPDAGPDTGTGNPDSGIPVPDGGFDAGTGWMFATPSCDGGTCDFDCPPGSNLCSDGLCWDPLNAHD